MRTDRSHASEFQAPGSACASPRNLGRCCHAARIGKRFRSGRQSSRDVHSDEWHPVRRCVCSEPTSSGLLWGRRARRGSPPPLASLGIVPGNCASHQAGEQCGLRGTTGVYVPAREANRVSPDGLRREAPVHQAVGADLRRDVHRPHRLLRMRISPRDHRHLQPDRLAADRATSDACHVCRHFVWPYAIAADAECLATDCPCPSSNVGGIGTRPRASRCRDRNRLVPCVGSNAVQLSLPVCFGETAWRKVASGSGCALSIGTAIGGLIETATRNTHARRRVSGLSITFTEVESLCRTWAMSGSRALSRGPIRVSARTPAVLRQRPVGRHQLRDFSLARTLRG